MRLADDERGRVPFALVAVVLLLGSAALSTTLHPTPARGTPDAAVAVDRTSAEAQTALRSAVSRAASDAGREPVVEPADTAYGSVLNDSTPFRDYLRIRIYREARASLTHVDREAGAYEANASLPPTPNATALRHAKRSVAVERVGDGALRVRVENVSVAVTRGGRTVDRQSETVTVVVPSPVLALHDRTERYERRLNRGPLDGSGLGRDLSAQLYLLAWARGYAQYGGAPIQNVVTNRHVELLTNRALLSSQRSAFGRSDPGGRAAMQRATKRVAVTDLLAAAPLDEDRWADAVLATRDAQTDAPSSLPDATNGSGPSPNATVTVDVGPSADRAFHGVAVAESGDESLSSVLESAYTVDARLAATTIRTRSERRPSPSAPPGNWTLLDERVDETVTVTDGAAPAPDVADGWHALETYDRRVERTGTVVRRWRNGNETRRTSGSWTTVHRVGLAVVGRHGSVPHAPDRSVATVHERGGPLDGPNLADVRDGAVATLVRDRGGASTLARRATTGDLDAEPVAVSGTRPDELERWAYADLAELRERVRNVSVRVPRAAVATGDVDPAARLAAELRSRRAALVDAPATYPNVADRSRVAARAAYVDRVVTALERRSDDATTTRRELDDAVADAVPMTADEVWSGLDAHDDRSDPARRPFATGGPGGRLVVSVDGSPTYLTLSPVSSDRADALEPDEEFDPLVARNVNVFTVPYGDAAEDIVDALFGDADTVSLRTAAHSLRAANRTLAETDDAALAARRTRLQSSVATSVARVRARLAAELRMTGLTRPEREAAVAAGFDRWNSTDGRALAAANGSAADAVAAAALRRTDATDRRRDAVRVHLRVALADATRSSTVRPSTSAVNETTHRTRTVRNELLEAAVADGLENAADRARERLGGSTVTVQSGVPITPVPGSWYATANVWHVTVRGEYAAFAVRGHRGRPRGGGATTPYRRDGSAVRLDVTGDGERETLGRSTRVSFEVTTAVVVVVPPGPRGVGDVDGNADERSAGWPTPGLRNASQPSE